MAAVWKGLSISALMLSTWFGCIGAHAAEPPAAKSPPFPAGKLLITGSTTLAPMVSAIAKRFQSLHPGAQIEVQEGGSGKGVEDVIGGKADIGMASRALTDKESVLYSYAIGRDGICVIVNKNNPVKSLSNRQVADIYTGAATNWRKVGGLDGTITVVNSKADRGAVELFTHFFGIKFADIKAQLVAADNLGRIKAVAGDVNGIAYASIGFAQSYAESGTPIRLLPVDGVAASAKNIRTGNFPISRPLLLLTKEIPTGLAKEFISFSLSSQITDLVRQHDFVPYLD